MSKDDTEATCEVVNIHAILKHPKADRLEIAHFAFANGLVPDYQVVVGKDEFSVGDLAVYISDDMLVPVDRPEFAFLKDKAKAGYHRVRACRLRGEMSTGMLVKVPDKSLKLGHECAAYMGAIKYVNPLEKDPDSQSGNRVYKPQSWLNSLITRIGRFFYHPPAIPDYSVISLRKVPDLFKENESVVITEKIHGSNIRFGKVGSRVYIGSHHTEKSDSRPWFIRLFSNRKRGPGYYGNDVWSKWFNRVFDSKEKLNQLPNNIIFYGELFGPGIQPWTYGLRNTEVLVFDAYNIKEKRWLSWAEICSNLPDCMGMVPVIQWAVPYSRELVKSLAEGNSSVVIEPKTAREGVVVRSVDWKRAGKLVSDRYLASEH